jgi:hypothetical protein
VELSVNRLAKARRNVFFESSPKYCFVNDLAMDNPRLRKVRSDNNSAKKSRPGLKTPYRCRVPRHGDVSKASRSAMLVDLVTTGEDIELTSLQFENNSRFFFFISDFTFLGHRRFSSLVRFTRSVLSCIGDIALVQNDRTLGITYRLFNFQRV